MKKAIDTPLYEITLRRYEKPYNLTGRELCRKLSLSMGLLQPGDSRDVIVDILLVLLKSKKQDKMLSSDEIRDEVIEYRTSENLSLNGTAASNIRRQLKRMRAIFLVEKVKNNYRIFESASLSSTFEEKIINYLLPSIVERVREYCAVIDEYFT